MCVYQWVLCGEMLISHANRNFKSLKLVQFNLLILSLYTYTVGWLLWRNVFIQNSRWALVGLLSSISRNSFLQISRVLKPTLKSRIFSKKKVNRNIVLYCTFQNCRNKWEHSYSTTWLNKDTVSTNYDIVIVFVFILWFLDQFWLTRKLW